MLLNVLVLDGDIERVRGCLRCSLNFPVESLSYDHSFLPLAPQRGQMTTTTGLMTLPLRRPWRGATASERRRNVRTRERLLVVEIHQTRRMKTGIHGRSRGRRRSRPGTDVGRENVALMKQMAAMAEAMSKDGRNEIWTTTTAAKMRTSTSRGVSQLRRRVHRDRGESQAGGTTCPSRTLNQKPVLHTRAAVVKHIRNVQSRVQGHKNISSPHHPRGDSAYGRLRP